jgi:hypothetical protein
MHIELKQTRVLIRKILLFLSIISLYIEALVPSFHRPLKTSSIKLFGLLSEPGGDFPGPVSWSLPLNGLTKFPEDVTVGVAFTVGP